jgi:hypothetical protein
MPGGALPNPAQIAGSRWQYAVAVLDGINAPAPALTDTTPSAGSVQNVWAMLAWMKAEGSSARFNPLDTTQRESGSTTYPGNSAGVQEYTSWDSGVKATVSTLQNGRYGGIIDAFRGTKGCQAIAQAVGQSPWGTSGSLMGSVAAGWGNGSGPLTIQGIGYAGGQVAGVSGGNIGPDLGSIAGHVKDAITSPLSWGAAIAAFLGKLLDRQTWIRLLEIVGALILGVAGLFVLAHALGADQAIAKVAPIAALAA